MSNWLRKRHDQGLQALLRTSEPPRHWASHVSSGFDFSSLDAASDYLKDQAARSVALPGNLLRAASREFDREIKVVSRDASAGWPQNLVGAELRDEPSFYYSDDDIRDYKADLKRRMDRITHQLVAGNSPELAEWNKVKPAILAFTDATKLVSGKWQTRSNYAKVASIAFPVLIPFAFGPSIAEISSNKALWEVGKNAEKLIQDWELIASAVPPAQAPAQVPYGPPYVPGQPGAPMPGPTAPPPYVAPWYHPGGDGSSPNDPGSDGRRRGHGPRHHHEEEGDSMAWLEDVKPYAIGGAALVALGIAASLAKSFRS